MAEIPESRPGIEGVDLFTRAYDWPQGGGVGQCMACGFLARRSIERSRPGLEEATVEDRKDGNLFTMATSHKAVPWCAVGAADLPRELDQAMAEAQARSGLPSTIQGALPESEVVEVLVKDRKCPEWYPYTQFLSPADHRAERDMLRLEEDRKAHQTRLAEMELEVHKGSQRIAEALKDIATQTDRFTTRWTRAAFALALVGVVLVLLSYLFPDLGEQIGRWIDQALGHPLGFSR